MAVTFTTVIVTRNRHDALALSLPLHLSQSRLPTSVLVIDSSDDPSANRDLVKRLNGTTSVGVEHIISPPGMTVQRNIGLSRVTTDVVFFPDDDSLVCPGALEAMMRIYDRDTDGIIGGVCSAESRTPPPGMLDTGTPYKVTRGDVIRKQIEHQRFALQARFFREPFHEIADRLYTRLPPPPAWLAEENAITVPLMTGFRMSFRSDVIRRIGFNEALGRYALFEDIAASLDTLNTHLLIGARQAQIYHHKAPGKRANGRALGVMQVLNLAYVIARSDLWQTSAPDRPAIRRALRRFNAYKLVQYAAGARSGFGRDRLRGAWDATRMVPTLLDAPAEDCDRCYVALRQALFASED